MIPDAPNLWTSGKRAVAATQWLTILGLCVALGMLALGVVVLIEARGDAWRQAKVGSDNLSLALERDIARNLAVYDLSLRGAIEAAQLPGIEQTSPAIRHTAVFDRAADAEYLGSLLVLDAAGNIRLDSTSDVPHKLNLADRDYFQVHKDRADVGLYVSRPFRSRLRGGDYSMAISRRMNGPDGRFAGVAVGTMRLAYFQKMFEQFKIGKSGFIALFRADGGVVARHPNVGQAPGAILRDRAMLPRFTAAPFGQFVVKSTADEVERLYTFRQIDHLPLVLNIAVGVDEVFAAWRRKALVIGSVLVALCGATLALSLLFRREVLRRMDAERALMEAASTDSLTGLANRRAFDEELAVEWRRAIRGRWPLAMLMMDADAFKAFNDLHGHQAGDDVLRQVADVIQRSIRRPGDLGVRYGGEEFVALLPNTDQPGASAIADRIRAGVAALEIANAGSPSGWVTISIGVGVMRPRFGDMADNLVRKADTALFEAKRAGRNRVVSAPDDNRPALAEVQERRAG